MFSVVCDASQVHFLSLGYTHYDMFESFSQENYENLNKTLKMHLQNRSAGACNYCLYMVKKFLISPKVMTESGFFPTLAVLS